MAARSVRHVDVGWIARTFAAVPAFLCWVSIGYLGTFLFRRHLAESDGFGIIIFSLLAFLFAIFAAAVAIVARVDRDSHRWFVRILVGAIAAGLLIAILVVSYLFLA